MKKKKEKKWPSSKSFSLNTHSTYSEKRLFYNGATETFCPFYLISWEKETRCHASGPHVCSCRKVTCDTTEPLMTFLT